MASNSFVPVAFSEDINIYCPTDGRFTFYNSPYPAHHMNSGVDIYPRCNFKEMSFSPVSGKVLETRRVKCPKGKHFKDCGFDWVILIKSSENTDRIIKILHVKPTVQRGDKVEPGDELGKLLRSGYFNFWTDPHLHIEVKNPSDPLRVRGGFKFKSRIEVNNTAPVNNLKGKIVESKSEYSLVVLEDDLKHGIPVDVGGCLGLLDGGIPHYGYVGTHVNGRPLVDGLITLCSKPIARIETVYHNMCLAKFLRFHFQVKGIYIGLSLYLFPVLKPFVKMVPPKPGKLIFERSEEISIVIV